MLEGGEEALATALSQQSPFRLMLRTAPMASSALMYSSEPYGLPVSEWWISPGTGWRVATARSVGGCLVAFAPTRPQAFVLHDSGDGRLRDGLAHAHELLAEILSYTNNKADVDTTGDASADNTGLTDLLEEDYEIYTDDPTCGNPYRAPPKVPAKPPPLNCKAVRQQCRSICIAQGVQGPWALLSCVRSCASLLGC